jgi:hypothetical protein
MAAPMHPLLEGDPHPLKGSLLAPPAVARLRRLDMGIDWESPGKEFGTSVKEFFAGERPPKDGDLSADRTFKVEWVRGKLPGRAFLASSLWHVVAIWALLLPIWGFLPSAQPTLAPVQIDYDLYDPPNLRHILLASSRAKPSPPLRKRDDASKEPIQRGADAYHPRQTIISIPVHVTHPRQTLIEPEAPPTPPKVVPLLPNIVQWADKAAPKLQIPLAPTAAAPRIQRRAVRDVAAPEVANSEKTPGPLISLRHRW